MLFRSPLLCSSALCSCSVYPTSPPKPIQQLFRQILIFDGSANREFLSYRRAWQGGHFLHHCKEFLLRSPSLFPLHESIKLAVRRKGLFLRMNNQPCCYPSVRHSRPKPPGMVPDDQKTRPCLKSTNHCPPGFLKASTKTNGCSGLKQGCRY